ncbi:hypothetical protein BDQ94DRAFT_151841 [Aspergillus welwitschiae]|uniref:Uncharacterized protein n=1 Tax=Aspergillus welwitschiae TaxID=1341132 RepID=A0A3F3PNS5_9EURO|nr:hypothetical protein BDQ94DRAFT_151841 [Aspergillus welwitschiae]RDH28559.1 hypothetical protein BDQ94DRAFT_151841 [Aspergillus welwitschiae]
MRVILVFDLVSESALVRTCCCLLSVSLWKMVHLPERSGLGRRGPHWTGKEDATASHMVSLASGALGMPRCTVN